MEGPRAPKEQEYQEVLNFLDHNLRKDSPWSIAEEYPTAVNLRNLNNFRIIKNKNEILSHALIKPTIVKTKRGLFKVGCIGSVVTSEGHRNQGYSKQVMDECISAVKEQGCDFAILWTSMFDFYRKQGFELGGSEVSFVLNKPFQIDVGQSRVMENQRVDKNAIFRLYSQHTVTSIRVVEDFEKYMKIPNSRLYTSWLPNGTLEAYAIEGKGADLQGYVHEWGGSVDGILKILSMAQKNNNGKITIICPSHSQNLITRLEKIGANRFDGYLGMINIVNPQSFFPKIVRNVRTEWGIDNFTLTYQNGVYQFGLGENLFQTESHSDIVALLFGPTKAKELFSANQETAEFFDKVFPIEMWIWGWDSV